MGRASNLQDTCILQPHGHQAHREHPWGAGGKWEPFPDAALGRHQGTRVMLCADSKGLMLLRSSARTTEQNLAPHISTPAPCKALLQSLGLYQSSSLSWDAEGMGLIPAAKLVVCTHSTPAPALPETQVGISHPRAFADLELSHKTVMQNPHVCGEQILLGGDHAPAAPQHPPLQVLQGDCDPQAVSQEEEGSQDVSPLHHLTQWAPLQHPWTENIPRLLRQEANMDQDLERQGEGSVLGGVVLVERDKLGFPGQNDLWSPIPSSSFCRL